MFNVCIQLNPSNVYCVATNRRGPRLGGVNLRKSRVSSQIRLPTGLEAPSVHAMLPDLDGRAHAPSVSAVVKKFRASAKAFDAQPCRSVDLRSRRGATRSDESLGAVDCSTGASAADRRDGCHMCGHRTATNHSRSSPSPPSHLTTAHMFCLVLRVRLQRLAAEGWRASVVAIWSNERAGELCSSCADPTATQVAVARSVGEQEHRRCACFVVLAVVCLARTVSSSLCSPAYTAHVATGRAARRPDLPVYHVV